VTTVGVQCSKLFRVDGLIADLLWCQFWWSMWMEQNTAWVRPIQSRYV